MLASSYTNKPYRHVPGFHRGPTAPRSIRISQLRIVPIAFTVRVLPFGQSTPVQPYFGGGLGIINWRYRETGEFVDFGAGREIFEDTFEDSGSSTGAIFCWRSSLRGPAIQCGWRDPLSARGGRSLERLRRLQDRPRRLDVQLHGRHAILISGIRDPGPGDLLISG